MTSVVAALPALDQQPPEAGKLPTATLSTVVLATVPYRCHAAPKTSYVVGLVAAAAAWDCDKLGSA